MTVVLIQRSERLVTVGELTPEQAKVVKTMITVGNPLENVQKYLEKQGHTILDRDKDEEMSILLIPTEDYTEEDIQNLVKSLDKI